MPKSKNMNNQAEISELTNHVVLAGTLDAAPSYSHEFDNVKFYSIRVKVMRSNGNKYDVLHAFIPEDCLIIDSVLLDSGVRVKLEGYLVQSELKAMSDVSVRTESIQLISSEVRDENCLVIGGIIHRIFDLRPINDSKRVVKSMILKHTATNGEKSRNLTIKVSAWNSTARLVEDRFNQGDHVFVRGQLESKIVRLDKQKAKKSSVVLHEASAAVILDIPTEGA
ncbi:MAG: single-stranded DNA-binding protein [Lachnospiraceae bacterium]|nr:single-stranded DNA-binding protein [Lachnospiraceae bacterium]